MTTMASDCLWPQGWPAVQVVASVNYAGLQVHSTHKQPLMAFTLERTLLSWVSVKGMLVLHVLSTSAGRLAANNLAAGGELKKLHLLSDESDKMAELLSNFAHRVKQHEVQQQQQQQQQLQRGQRPTFAQVSQLAQADDPLAA